MFGNTLVQPSYLHDKSSHLLHDKSYVQISLYNGPIRTTRPHSNNVLLSAKHSASVPPMILPWYDLISTVPPTNSNSILRGVCLTNFSGPRPPNKTTMSSATKFNVWPRLPTGPGFGIILPVAAFVLPESTWSQVHCRHECTFGNGTTIRTRKVIHNVAINRSNMLCVLWQPAVLVIFWNRSGWESDWLIQVMLIFNFRLTSLRIILTGKHNTKNIGLFTYQYFAYSHRLESNQVVWHTIMYLLIGPEVQVYFKMDRFWYFCHQIIRAGQMARSRNEKKEGTHA